MINYQHTFYHFPISLLFKTEDNLYIKRASYCPDRHRPWWRSTPALWLCSKEVAKATRNWTEVISMQDNCEWCLRGYEGAALYPAVGMMYP